mmetsp:Transcript_161360/g.286099  ORF Transcript_161360/g.286099 Transcript_161360/m.286099 type:complete len:1355 (+) Transcript_161360:74-4138(+)
MLGVLVVYLVISLSSRLSDASTLRMARKSQGRAQHTQKAALRHQAQRTHAIWQEKTNLQKTGGKDINEGAKGDEQASEDKEAVDEEEEQEEETTEKDAKKSATIIKDKGILSKADANSDSEMPVEEEGPTPPPAPFAHLYEEADAVARDAELRRGNMFHPEGSKADVDVSKQDQFQVDAFFNQDPNIFGHCVLIRDFAEPLRVGSAMIRKPSTLHRGTGESFVQKDTSARHGSNHSFRAAGAHLPRFPQPSSLGYSAEETEIEDLDVKHHTGTFYARRHRDQEDEDRLPDDLLVPEGGVMDRSGGPNEDDADLQVNMFAFLRSVAGEVAVIPHGTVAKWSSKKKVPIAGYLCTTEEGPVLHTLPTPCLPTSLDINGLPFPPPKAAPSSAGAPSPAREEALINRKVKVDMADEEEDVEGAAAQAEGDADALEHEIEAEPASFLQMGQAPASAPAASPSASPAPARPPPRPPPPRPAGIPAVDPYAPFHVWVGSVLLEFKTKPKAERFCTRLAKKIADDLGDAEWDADRIDQFSLRPDMTVASFLRLSRKPAPAWTLGLKSVLVVVMDWQAGDKSRQPYSHQTLTPKHYESKIFPRVKEAFKRMSYDKFDIDVTVLPEVIRYVRPRSRYTAEGYPFPALYNAARESLDGNLKWGKKYNFDDYDLVYVISPQQAPTGTKGVAWVGAKGAICNGCEAISENFQVMVAVHELGHNLGLWHASSKSLEYGNVYDWMGNYPDVKGLSYGFGYKLDLHWLPQSILSSVSSSSVSSLNDLYYLASFDATTAPQQGQVMGVKIDLTKNKRNLFISYRSTNEGEEGVYMFWQDRDKPNSELIDSACNSPSQRDARLQPGWTYMDPSGEVVIHAKSVENGVATVHIYKAPKSSKDVAAIRGRKFFTDGQYKCPQVCTDSDLLLAQYNGCKGLAQDGYCKGGQITMSGKKYKIDTDLCPNACNACEKVLAGATISQEGCDDRNIKISGLSCRQAAAKGYCDYNTNMGHVGQDLCPKSCNKCPPKPAASDSAGAYPDPAPVRTHGVDHTILKEEEAEPDVPTKQEADEEAEEEKEEAVADEKDAAEEDAKEKESPEEPICTDDLTWTDTDGDGCHVYADYIAQKKLTRKEACEYGGGVAQVHCRQTCESCEVTKETCQDKQCVTRWRLTRGACFVCSDWAAHCGEEHFAHDCPRTCGMCVAEGPETTPPLPTTPMPLTTTELVTQPPTEPPTTPPPCEDQDCVQGWLKSFGVCYKCSEFAADYCGRDEQFMKSCPKSCRICSDGELPCHDNFLPHTCKRYQSWGWCAHQHIAEHCKASCGICAADFSDHQSDNQLFPLPQSGAQRSLRPLPALLLALLALPLLRLTLP